MADVNRGLVSGNVTKLAVNLRLRHRVQGRCGLIQDDKGGVLVKGPGNGDFLSLAAGNIHAVFIQVLIQVGVQAEGFQPVAEARLHKALPGTVPVVAGAGGHILPQRHGKELEVLEHDGEDCHVVVVAVLADVDAVEQNLPFGGVVEPAQELNKGSLAAAVPSYHSKAPAHLELHAHMAQGVVF